MRRIVSWITATLAGLVLLFSYHTSTQSRMTADAAPGSTTDSAAASSSSAVTSEDDSTAEDGTTDDLSDDTAKAAVPSPSGSSSGSAGSSSSNAGGSAGTSASKTYQGSTVQTRWGPVQVQITVTGGKITKSEVLQVPWDNPKDQEINSYCVPILNSEVVKAQSAGIDMISGATVTSQGYIQSLQSALDKANL